MAEFHKYVRTPHIRGSRFQNGDHDLEAVPWEELAGKNLVICEKVDGSNVGISFSESGELLLQSRGHYLRGGPREKQFALLKQWSSARQVELFCVLGTRYVMYGENLFAKHTMFYDALPHYFLEFDVLDTQTRQFLSTEARKVLLYDGPVVAPVVQVKVLATGQFAHLSEMRALIQRSHFRSDDWHQNLCDAAIEASVDHVTAFSHTDRSHLMEGLYVKWEEGGIVKGRYKFVRESFTNSIMDQEQHWSDRPIIQNRLEPGAFERMFTS